MTSPDNPNRICKPGSNCACTFQFMVSIIITSVLLTIFYFLTVGLGYGMTYATVGTIYNMTTGYKIGFDTCYKGDCTICYNDQQSGFYGGCFMVGLICDTILVIIILIIWGLVYCCLYCVMPYFSKLNSEVVTAFESAQDIRNKSELEINSTTKSDEVINLEE